MRFRALREFAFGMFERFCETDSAAYVWGVEGFCCWLVA